MFFQIEYVLPLTTVNLTGHKLDGKHPFNGGRCSLFLAFRNLFCSSFMVVSTMAWHPMQIPTTHPQEVPPTN